MKDTDNFPTAKYISILLLIASAVLSARGLTAAEPVRPTEKMALWNGKDFNGWKLFVGDASVDVNSVWSVKNDVIHCKGKPSGYMRTLKDYADYKLHVEWRWAAKPTNSGILLHMKEPDKIWPDSIECQLLAGDAGDFIAIGNTDFKERTDKTKGLVPKKEQSSEKPAGEWNEALIVCRQNRIRIFINGVLQNMATETSVSSGKICLQSEGGPIEFRNVYIEPLRSREEKEAGGKDSASSHRDRRDLDKGEKQWVSLFDGKTFAGWEGNLDVFRIEDGTIVGGSLKKEIPRNEFLCTMKEFGDFELHVKFKLLGENPNAGIQFRSRRIPKHHEMIGYQADMGQEYWGCLYDESRRKTVLAQANREELDKVLRYNDWNEYVIRCEGKRIQLWLNGYQTVDYTETDDSIEQKGVIGLQIHSGLPSEAWYKDIKIKEL